MPPEIPDDFDFRIPDGDPAPVEGIFAFVFDPVNPTLTFTLDVEPRGGVDTVRDPLVELGPFDIPDAVLDLIA